MSSSGWIRLTQGMFTEVDSCDLKELSQYKWYAKRNTSQGVDYGKYYAARGIKEDGVCKTIYMHREIVNCPDGYEVDHKNDDSLCNKSENLQTVTRAEHRKRRYIECLTT